ncbi:MAG: hypothetical protein WD990_13485 [Acidimicrobiia bacterium]
MRVLSAIVFGAIGFLSGVLLQAPVGGVAFTDWRGPVASLTMAGFGTGTGMGFGRQDGESFRRGITGSAVGATTGLILGIAGSGILVTSVVAIVLAVSLLWEG